VIWGPQWLFLAVLIGVALLCHHEYSAITDAYGFGSAGALGFFAGPAILLTSWDGTLIITASALIVVVLALRCEQISHAWPCAALVVIGLVYIFGSWKSAIALRAANPYWLLYALALSWVGDIAAYYFGKHFGRRKLAPAISPGKTWLGAAASAAGSVLFGLIFLNRLLPAVPAWHVVLLSLIANAAGQCGDLTESALKRGAGVKDSGSVLPGHGGMLDRVDSTLFTLPVVSFYLHLVRST
jgi:phosphatidate cytidylyltransferase